VKRLRFDLLIGVVLLFGIPSAVLWVQALRSGLSVPQLLRQILHRAEQKTAAPEASGGASVDGPPMPLFETVAIGSPFKEPPRIAFVTICDLDKDGRADVLACDDIANRIVWLRQTAPRKFREIAIPVNVPAPAHVTPCDIDRDGDLDLLVACMGMLFPNNDRIGSVVILENDGKQDFIAHRVVEHIARVTDVRPADFDADGDVDLVAGQFGYDDGEIRWLENHGDWRFESHILLRLSGTIHTPVADMDGDGDPDFVALVSQEWEEVYLFENVGGAFKTHLIYGSPNQDYGSSGIDLVDFDGDGDLDVLYTNGDAFDYIPPRPRPWHGVQWLENTGDSFRFTFHRLGDVPGAAVARTGDFDGDGDVDVLVCSAYNYWERPDAWSMFLFENVGSGRFVRHGVAKSPTHLIAMAVGDVDGDGRLDAVTGGMHVYPPYDRMARITVWYNRGGRSGAAAKLEKPSRR